MAGAAYPPRRQYARDRARWQAHRQRQPRARRRWPAGIRRRQGPLKGPGMDVLEQSFPVTLVVAPAGAPPLATAPADDPTLEPWVDAAGHVYGCSFALKNWCHIHIHGVGSF